MEVYGAVPDYVILKSNPPLSRATARLKSVMKAICACPIRNTTRFIASSRCLIGHIIRSIASSRCSNITRFIASSSQCSIGNIKRSIASSRCSIGHKTRSVASSGCSIGENRTLTSLLDWTCSKIHFFKSVLDRTYSKIQCHKSVLDAKCIKICYYKSVLSWKVQQSVHFFKAARESRKMQHVRPRHFDECKSDSTITDPTPSLCPEVDSLLTKQHILGMRPCTYCQLTWNFNATRRISFSFMHEVSPKATVGWLAFVS